MFPKLGQPRLGRAWTMRRAPLRWLVAASAVAVAPASIAEAQTSDLAEATVADIHAGFRAGELTCRQVTEYYLDRIAALDDQGPAFNAVITVNPAALEVADRMDAAFAAGPDGVGPLHCAPVLVKDNKNTQDMPTTGASVALKDMQPTTDAFVVARLREAGALMLAKVNLTEFAMGGTTISSLGGQTRNAYDLSRTPGGSSGGTGAAIAANMGLLGTGSDTGQSIRSPASANSLVGIRPSRGLLSRSGVIPLSVTQDEVGPITRTVADAARMLDVMAGYDPDDPITAFGARHRPTSYLDYLNPTGLEGKRIGVLRDMFGTEPVHAEVNAVTAEAIAMMRALGATVVDFTIPDFETLTTDMGTSAYETKAAMADYFAALADAAPLATLDEIVASGDFSDGIASSITSRLDVADPYAEPAYTAIFLRRDNLRKAVMAAMAEHELDAIFYPHQRRLVAEIGEEQLDRNGVLSNATGFPAITVPGGFSAPTAAAPVGVPIGVEFLGPAFSEGELIEIAYAFEQGTALRVPSPLAEEAWLEARRD